jgi:glycosyltransferase involved in cell wall biosynthesis
MKLLILSNNPDRASFRQRIGIHIPMLRERDVICEVAKLPGGPFQRRRLFSRAAGFDAVFLHRKMLSRWDAYWLGRYSRKLLYDFDDAVMYSDRKPQRTSRGRFGRFGRVVALADRVVAGNSYLANHARRFNEQVAVLPTSLDLSPYAVATPRPRDGKLRLIWIGSQSTIRYLADIKPVLEEVGKSHPNAVLRIVCDAFFDLQNMAVEKIPWSREGEAKALLESDIGLAPLPDNPFTRGKCGFKILQYQAASLPVVASPVGVNASYVTDGVTGYHALDHAGWVRAMCELIAHPQQRRSMGEQARSLVEEFDQPMIGRRFCRIVAECLLGADSDRREADRAEALAEAVVHDEKAY